MALDLDMQLHPRVPGAFGNIGFSRNGGYGFAVKEAGYELGFKFGAVFHAMMPPT